MRAAGHCKPSQAMRDIYYRPLFLPQSVKKQAELIAQILHGYKRKSTQSIPQIERTLLKV